ncbi:hypothetical protein [Streptomyces sp. B21-083]|uniref:hypothetical protein n=1 Tax=Streptomyces sp. B21-083 TaxID=3039410 RepID=UPI002FF07420
MPDQPTKLQAAIDLTLNFAQRLQHDTVLRASVRLTVEQSSFAQGELLPGTDISEVASTVVGSFTGLQVMSQAYSNRRDLPTRIAALWRLILSGLAAPGILPRPRTTMPPAPVAEAAVSEAVGEAVEDVPMDSEKEEKDVAKAAVKEDMGGTAG